MFRDRNFLRITLADLIVRSAYQMGKTPLLPIFAAALGASDVMLGLIVSVSTLTGMVSKPLVGFLSDRWGRKLWLIVGTCFFAFIPFAYWLVETPQHLVIIRVVHGCATAIYGPVTLAYVAENTRRKRAEKLAWFSIARNGGYIVGPAFAGWLLLTRSPQLVFTIIGLISCLAFLPVLRMNDIARPTANTRTPFLEQIGNALRQGSQTPAVWLSGGIESVTFVVLYALKAYLPIYALAQGYNTAEVGTFFAVQETAQIVFKPIGGRISDRRGTKPTIIIGMIGLAVVLGMVTMAQTWWTLLLLAGLLGVFQALIFPATTALIAEQLASANLGTGMGLVGTMRNFGKVVGPIVVGVLLTWFDFRPTFLILSVSMSVTALMLLIAPRKHLLLEVIEPEVPIGRNHVRSS